MLFDSRVMVRTSLEITESPLSVYYDRYGVQEASGLLYACVAGDGIGGSPRKFSDLFSRASHRTFDFVSVSFPVRKAGCTSFQQRRV